MAELVDARDLKSLGICRVGSSPTMGTTKFGAINAPYMQIKIFICIVQSFRTYSVLKRNLTLQLGLKITAIFCKPIEEIKMDNERKLATVEKILEINPHKNADRLELAIVRGWQCVVKKGEFKVGDPVVFCEIDSFLPVREEFEFLRPTCFRLHPELGAGFRLKTIRFRGELSQGLVLPISILDDNYIMEFGQDVTEFLKIQKYEAPLRNFNENNIGNSAGIFPYFIHKTGEDRIQNIWDKLRMYQADTEWTVTEKLDGSSVTVFYSPNTPADTEIDALKGCVNVCSRNFRLKLDPERSDFVKAAVRQGLIESLANLKQEIAIQGELVGLGIQGNKYKKDTIEIFIFNIWDILQQRYLVQDEFDKMMIQIRAACPEEKRNRILEVPNIGKIKLPETMIECLTFADGKSKINPSSNREGLVFKLSKVSSDSKSIVSFKVISNKFLLDEKD
jgi:RNA ligase (TIGR02306 family)